MTLRPYQQYGFDPNVEIGGDYFGVGAQVSGGGVVGVEVTKDHTSEAPCISTGVTNWFAAGFDTTVGSCAVLSVYNPTATPAVFNVSTFSASGYVAPAKFQGYAVGAALPGRDQPRHGDRRPAEHRRARARTSRRARHRRSPTVRSDGVVQSPASSAADDLGDLPAGDDGEQRHRADPLRQSRTHAGQRHAGGHAGAVSRPESDADRRALRQRRRVDHAELGHPGRQLRERVDERRAQPVIAALATGRATTSR